METVPTNPEVATNPVERSVWTILAAIGENPDREGLMKTPERVARSYRFLFSGYEADPVAALGTDFESSYDQMVILRTIEFYSMCEHHMLPFFGKAHIGYIPNGRVVGISKLARLVEVFSRRLQIQERLTDQIADTMQDVLAPEGCGVVLEAQHFCMVARGVQKQNSVMVTSSLRGAMLEDPKTREEFMSCVRQ